MKNFVSFIPAIPFLLAFYIYMIVVMWKIVNKAGDKGWKVLIPIYGIYVFCKVLDSASLFWVEFIGGIVLSVFMSVGDQALLYYIFTAIAMGALSIVVHIKFSINTAYCFGRRGGFAVGLVFLPAIYLSMLAFDVTELTDTLSNF